jgi:hypothetical protein
METKLSQNVDLKFNNFNLVWRISPLITITLLTLYFSLTIPLPFLAKVTSIPIPLWLLWLSIFLGALAILGVLSEKVIVDEQKIKVGYPAWMPILGHKGWSLFWSEIEDLKMRTTGQGGLVYYFITKEKDRAYLLPMRVAGFAKMLTAIEQNTTIDTQDIRPLSQPWMYFILLFFSLLLLLIDAWIISTAINLN